MLLYTLAKSQACPDGNKRLALILVETFLAINDRELDVDDENLADMILAAATSQMADRDTVIAHLADWLEGVIAPLSEDP